MMLLYCLSGAGIYEGVRVEGVDVEGGRVTGVRTNKGNISCEIFVNCAGQVHKLLQGLFESVTLILVWYIVFVFAIVGEAAW